MSSILNDESYKAAIFLDTDKVCAMKSFRNVGFISCSLNDDIYTDTSLLSNLKFLFVFKGSCSGRERWLRVDKKCHWSSVSEMSCQIVYPGILLWYLHSDFSSYLKSHCYLQYVSYLLDLDRGKRNWCWSHCSLQKTGHLNSWPFNL